MSVAANRLIEDLPGFAPVSCGNPEEAAIRAYERDGVVCLRGAFSQEWIEPLG